MNPTHYLYLIRPPRPTFVFDATPEEMLIMGRHMAYLQTFLAQGKLLLAGPTLDGVFGVGVFKVMDAAEAESIMQNDPAVVAGLMTPSMHPWHAGLSSV